LSAKNEWFGSRVTDTHLQTPFKLLTGLIMTGMSVGSYPNLDPSVSVDVTISIGNSFVKKLNLPASSYDPLT